MSADLPFFKYHPDPFATGTFRRLDEPVFCPCCGRETYIVYAGPFYSEDEVNNLCPHCIASGAAAEKYSGEFQDSESTDKVNSPEKLDELVHRTPRLLRLATRVLARPLRRLLRLSGHGRLCGA